MAYKKTIVVTIKDGDGKVVAVDQMPLPPNSTTDLVSEIEIVDVPSRPRRDDRSPLSPDALRLADLRVGMHVKVIYTGNYPNARSYSAVVVGKPTTNDLGFQVIPIITDDMEYKMGFVADMGLAPSRCGGVWNPNWYVTAE